MGHSHDRVADAIGFYPRLRAMAGIDTVWPYQFVVYLSLMTWGSWATFHLYMYDHRPDSTIFFIGSNIWIWLLTYVIGPPIAFWGYLLKRKDVGVILSFSGNSSLAWAMWTYASILYLTDKNGILSTVLVAAIALCITLRAIRDLFVISKMHKEHRQRRQ